VGSLTMAWDFFAESSRAWIIGLHALVVVVLDSSVDFDTLLLDTRCAVRGWFVVERRGHVAAMPLSSVSWLVCSVHSVPSLPEELGLLGNGLP